MTSIFKKSALLIAMLIICTSTFAGEYPEVEMATGLYQSGKIYVVVIVMALIFVGIAGYLIMLDRKISKLEKESK